jgi:hypothetical protein
MDLTRGRFLGYEFDRMVMLFLMVDGQREIPRAISTSAMDDLEGVAQPARGTFMRFRDRIEERAALRVLHIRLPLPSACLRLPNVDRRSERV